MSEYSNTLEAVAVAVAANQPVILWGPPGQGKTAAVQAMADAHGWHLETVIASIREPADFAGLPVVTPGADGAPVTTLSAPGWAQRLAATTSTAILFFDEASTAPPAVQAALLRVIHERVVGDLRLPEHVVIVCAANPPEQSADGWDLSQPAANRFAHLDWTLPVDAFVAGHTAGMWPTVARLRVPAAAVNAATGAVAGQVAAFLTARPALLTQVPTSAADAGRAWPSPRSWEAAYRMVGYARAAGVGSGVERLLLTSAVGQAATVEFTAWLADLDLPDPEDVLANPEKWDVPARGDRVHATGLAVLDVIRRDPSKANWLRFGAVLARIVAAGHADMAVMCGRGWIAIQRNTPGLRSAKLDPTVARALGPVMTDAGLIPE